MAKGNIRAPLQTALWPAEQHQIVPMQRLQVAYLLPSTSFGVNRIRVTAGLGWSVNVASLVSCGMGHDKGGK